MIKEIREAIKTKANKIRGNQGVLKDSDLNIIVTNVFEKWHKTREDESDFETLHKLICEAVYEEYK